MLPAFAGCESKAAPALVQPESLFSKSKLRSGSALLFTCDAN
jgi:hypothetical protein